MTNHKLALVSDLDEYPEASHGVLIYPNGASYNICASYCKYHIKWLRNNGFKLKPVHNPERCAGFTCGHGTVTVRKQ